MEPRDLVKVWDAPDHSKLVPKQISIRLPILAAAKLAALTDLYPSKRKSQMIADLIATAIDQVIEGLDSKKGPYLGTLDGDMMFDPEMEEHMDMSIESRGGPKETTTIGMYQDVGPKGHFYQMLKKHLRELENEANISEPINTPDSVIYEEQSGR